MTHTKGNVIVEDIKVGDIHYEFEYTFYIKSKVLTLPQPTTHEDGTIYWSWESERLSTGEIINYGVSEGYSHYGPNLYDYEAYSNCIMI